ncbi:unnamed protein product [Chrysodeixis includens]|uniref:G-protein coupled receptors family 2 profile 2 domain-containing protein n=1 Tax=Chrysodeixis includens TaxID=689277 RepID=A0A9N8L4Q4_CHRIL|nr:unnamed protein product [Chrysodeixis includens]
MFFEYFFILLWVMRIESGVISGVGTTSHKNLVNKCCPKNQYVGKRKMCVFSEEAYNFSGVQVYDDDMNKVDKGFNELLELAPEKFADMEFKFGSLDVVVFGLKPYVLQNGDLMLEHPNEYNRWTYVPKAKYCIDYRLMGEPSIRYWYHPPQEPEVVYEMFEFLKYGMLVSCFFMLLVLIVYCLLPELRNLCGMILMATISSLLLAFLFLVSITIKLHSVNTCIGLTLATYYFFLSSFSWMTVMSFDIWWTFRGYSKARPIHRRGDNIKFLTYCLFAYGVPLVLTIFMGVLNSVNLRHWPWFITPHVAETQCFISGGYKFIYLYIPMLILIVCNWLFYLMTALNVWQSSRGSAVLVNVAAGNQKAHQRQRNRFLLYLKLSVVMGLMYVFEIISFRYPGYKIWYVIDAYNLLIGFALFLIFVCKKKILRKLLKRFSNKNFTSWISKSYSSTASDSNQDTAAIPLKVCVNLLGKNAAQTRSIQK